MFERLRTGDRGLTLLSGAALHEDDFPLLIALVLCAGVHTSQFSWRKLCPCIAFAPCRSAAIYPAT
jgi:hypothetical protein